MNPVMARGCPLSRQVAHMIDRTDLIEAPVYRQPKKGFADHSLPQLLCFLRAEIGERRGPLRALRRPAAWVGTGESWYTSECVCSRRRLLRRSWDLRPGWEG